MPMTPEHKELIRDHFKGLLGRQCLICETSFNLEFHHITPTLIGEGRGSTERLWELFDSFDKDNIVLLCRECHCKIHGVET